MDEAIRRTTVKASHTVSLRLSQHFPDSSQKFSKGTATPFSFSSLQEQSNMLDIAHLSGPVFIFVLVYNSSPGAINNMKGRHNLVKQSKNSSGIPSPTKLPYEFPKRDSSALLDPTDSMLERLGGDLEIGVSSRVVAPQAVGSPRVKLEDPLRLPPISNMGPMSGLRLDFQLTISRTLQVKVEDSGADATGARHPPFPFTEKPDNDSVSRGSGHHFGGNRSINGSIRSHQLGFTRFADTSFLGDFDINEHSRLTKLESSSMNGDLGLSLGKRVSRVVTFQEDVEDEDEKPKPSVNSKRKPSGGQAPTPLPPKKSSADMEAGAPNTMSHHDLIDQMYYGQNSNPLRLEEVDIHTEETAHPTVVDNFKKQLRSKMMFPGKEHRIAHLYYKKIQTLLRLGDLELAVASLLIDELSWQKFSEGDTSLFNLKDLKEVYVHFFSCDPEPLDLSIFFQLFFSLIFSKKHLNNFLTIHIDTESLDRRYYAHLHNTYKVWQQFLSISPETLSARRLNERFNKLK